MIRRNWGVIEDGGAWEAACMQAEQTLRLRLLYYLQELKHEG